MSDLCLSDICLSDLCRCIPFKNHISHELYDRVASQGAEGLTSRRSNKVQQQVRLGFGNLIGQIQFGSLDLRPVEMPPHDRQGL